MLIFFTYEKWEAGKPIQQDQEKNKGPRYLTVVQSSPDKIALKQKSDLKLKTNQITVWTCIPYMSNACIQKLLIQGQPFSDS